MATMNPGRDSPKTVLSTCAGLLLLLGAEPACMQLGAPADVHLSYRVDVKPGAPFVVELRAEGLSGRPSFRLLNGWGMLQGMGGHVRGVRAQDDRGRDIPFTQEEADGETWWRLRRAPRGVLVLRYEVVPYDLHASPEASFATPERFLVLGYSAFLVPGTLGSFEPTDLRVKVVSPHRTQWSAWPRSRGEYRPATAHDLWSGVVVGGEFEAFPLSAGSTSVTVLTEGRGQRATGIAIANRLLPVLREMRGYFGSAPRADSLRVLAVYRLLPEPDRYSVMTGTSEEGVFLSLATPDRFQAVEPLTVLAAHECLHFYLGGAVTAQPEPPYRNAPELAWFMEGLTEYLAYQLMEKAGILSAEAIRRVTAQKYADYRRTPGWEVLTVADAARRMEDIDVYPLVYSRGYLAARLLDREMTAAGGARCLEAALRSLFLRYNVYREGVPVTRGRVRESLEARARGAGRVIDLYAEGRDPIPDPFPQGGDDTAAALGAHRP